jgi:hypothetical protein
MFSDHAILYRELIWLAIADPLFGRLRSVGQGVEQATMGVVSTWILVHVHRGLGPRLSQSMGH